MAKSSGELMLEGIRMLMESTKQSYKAWDEKGLTANHDTRDFESVMDTLSIALRLCETIQKEADNGKK